MADLLVDTNVLIVGSGAVEPRFPDVGVDAAGIAKVFEWLVAFQGDGSRRLVVDTRWEIPNEYNNKLSDQHFGMQVFIHKMTQGCLRYEAVEYDRDGYALVPEGLAAVDNSDKKFVAAALNDPSHIHIVNAADSDWRQHAAALKAHGIVIEELLP